MSVTENSTELGVIHPPKWLPGRVHYETLSGSHAYGVANENSDTDVVGFCIPPKEIVFPHMRGEIHGFGRQKKEFKHFDADQFEDADGEVWDLTMFSIVEYFAQCMDNNPNWLETLFTPERCLITNTTVAKHVRNNRKLFLHKGSFHRFRGFTKSQINKMKKRGRNESRLLKYGYHAVRLIDEVDQILSEGELVLDNNVEKLRAIREGEWSIDEIENYCDSKEDRLQELYDNSEVIPNRPDEDAIKVVLLECLEEAYGSLEGCIVYGRWG